MKSFQRWGQSHFMPLFTLGRTTFPRKEDAEKRVKEILLGTPIDQPLAGDDLRLILGVLARHPHSEKKLKGGIVGITVAINTSDTGLSALGFRVTRPTGPTRPSPIKRRLGPTTIGKAI